MSYATFAIDRRAAYYARIAELIAADPLDFYTRAEKGRRFLANLFPRTVPAPFVALPGDVGGEGGKVIAIRKRRA